MRDDIGDVTTRGEYNPYESEPDYCGDCGRSSEERRIIRLMNGDSICSVCYALRGDDD